MTKSHEPCVTLQEFDPYALFAQTLSDLFGMPADAALWLVNQRLAADPRTSGIQLSLSAPGHGPRRSVLDPEAATTAA